MPRTKTIKKSKSVDQKQSFFEALGKRKTAVARVRLFVSGDKEIVVNERTFGSYFPTVELQQIVKEPLEKIAALPNYKVIAQIKGGGLHAQAEALRHGLARALVLFDKEIRKKLKKSGFLTRDARMRERKKPGLKRARRAPQWRKR